LQSTEPSGPGDAFGQEIHKPFKARELPARIYGSSRIRDGGGDDEYNEGGGGNAFEDGGGGGSAAESQAERFEQLYYDARRVRQRNKIPLFLGQ
jgi:hypothetical protein